MFIQNIERKEWKVYIIISCIISAYSYCSATSWLSVNSLITVYFKHYTFWYQKLMRKDQKWSYLGCCGHFWNMQFSVLFVCHFRIGVTIPPNLMWTIGFFIKSPQLYVGSMQSSPDRQEPRWLTYKPTCLRIAALTTTLCLIVQCSLPTLKELT